MGVSEGVGLKLGGGSGVTGGSEGQELGSVLGSVLGLALGVAMSQYFIYALVGWLFAQAVFFTVKMM